MDTEPIGAFELGDFVQRNPATWVFNALDEYGRGRGIGIVVASEEKLEEGEYRIEWPSGWSVEEGSHLLPAKMGTEMHVENVAPIQEWAKKRGYRLLGMPTNANRLNLLALAPKNEVIGEISIVQVNDEPCSFLITARIGRMILDESWGDTKSLSRCLDLAARLIQERHQLESDKPDWGFAFGRIEDCVFIPDAES